ncbi:replication initiation protein [Vibrio crassostreae]|uniref:replication initiation protein n=1 Tax=Vibrio crassostreae TaxID=246167 RepID=UPI001B314C8D|nr:replication initiation protein [Vibrio crassostreae]
MKTMNITHVVSHSKAITALENSSKTITQLVYSVLGAINPKDEVLEKEVAEKYLPLAKEKKIERFGEEVENDLDFEQECMIEAIKRYYSDKSELCEFEFEIGHFTSFWSNYFKVDDEGELVVDDEMAIQQMNPKKKLRSAIATFHKNNPSFKKNVAFTNGTSEESNVMVFTDMKLARRKHTEKKILVDTVAVTVNPSFMPYLVMLRDVFKQANYVMIPIRFLAGKSDVAMSVLQLLITNYVKQGQSIHLTLDEFREGTGYTSESYKVYKYLKRNIIKKALDEINEDPRINIEVEENRYGRKVESLTFKIFSDSLDAAKSTAARHKRNDNGLTKLDFEHHAGDNKKVTNFKKKLNERRAAEVQEKELSEDNDGRFF